MSSAIEIAATAVKAPGEVYVRATVTTAEVLQLVTEDWDSNWITVQAESDDVYIKFGATAASVSAGNVPAPATTSAATTPVVAAVGGCLHIPAGTQKEFYLRDWVKLTSQGIFMAHVSRAITATGSIRFNKSSGPRDL